MSAHGPGARDAAELRLGPQARALAPRARLGAPRASGELCVSVRHEALAPAERAALEALPGARWCREGSPRALPGERTFVAPCPALRALARELPTAAVLLAAWDAASRPPARTRLMGIVNVTPDSFSDGGRFLDPRRAVAHGLELEAQGAEILDVGGESTRPGAEPVPLAEELERVLPVVEGLALRSRARLSVDTRKSAVARAALERGARMVNDVSAGRDDPEMLAVVAASSAGFVAMHMRGEPRTMQDAPSYEEPVAEVLEFLRERAASCVAAGIAPEGIVIDPGLGFGKRVEDNVALLAHAAELRSLGLPLLLGPSRKSFLARLVEGSGSRLPADPSRRMGGTLAAVAAAVWAGAEIVRVHDVAEAAQAVAVASALKPRLRTDETPS